MGTDTSIGWTDHTYNPWWGCARVSPGCQHCYAETFAKRTGHDVWGKGSGRRFFGDKHWDEPRRWDRAAAVAGVPALVFCASMADMFEDHPALPPHRARLFELIQETPHLRWQLLTKRPENVPAMAPLHWRTDWPAHVWMGTTVEDQQRGEERVPRLIEIPAPVRFVSAEPLLGAVDLDPWLYLSAPSTAGPFSDATGRRRRTDGAGRNLGGGGVGGQAYTRVPSADIDWLIIGGESGANHRPLNLDHARLLRDQALEAKVPLFFKQVGGRTPTAGGDELDGQRWKQFPPEAGRSAP